MTPTAKHARGTVELDSEECKGCGFCVEACPPRCLSLSDGLNRYGVHPAVLEVAEACTGCGICFFVCPEPGAVTVYRLVAERSEAEAATAA